MKTKIISILSVLTCININLFPQDTTINKSVTVREKPHWLVPSYFNVQYAGNIGFMSETAGWYLYEDKVYLDLGYGYAPSSKAGRDIHNGIMRIGYKPWAVDFNVLKQNFTWKPFFVNLTLTKQIKSSYTWQELPNFYPKDYYPQNAFRLHLDLGTSLKHDFGKTKLELYWLVTINDMYVTYFNYYYYHHWIRWHKIFSQAVGMNIILF